MEVILSNTALAIGIMVGLCFLGLGIGEIGVSSTLFACIGYIVLLFNSYYKKEIPDVVNYFCNKYNIK